VLMEILLSDCKEQGAKEKILCAVPFAPSEILSIATRRHNGSIRG
jgi:hypothetical protein